MPLSNEQIEKIWKWLGGTIKITPSEHHPRAEYWTWIDPQGKEVEGDPPDFNLDFLFKYAVPKLHYVELKAGLEGKGYFSVKVSTGIEMYYYPGLVTDPAEALAMLILKVIEAGE